MTDYVQVITTTASRDDAERVARLLVEKRLAGCAQIVGPITSVYRWKGAVETAEEWQCLAKTRRDLFGELSAALRAAHPYETPEILATPILDGDKAYLDWLDAELKRPG